MNGNIRVKLMVKCTDADMMPTQLCCSVLLNCFMKERKISRSEFVMISLLNEKKAESIIIKLFDV